VSIADDLRSFFPGVASSDPIASPGAVSNLAAVSLARLPSAARHAARVDPLDALRAE